MAGTDKKIVGVIPARYASTRLPGKMLLPICGRPLIAWVLERAGQAKTLSSLVVATDDQRIAETVEAEGGTVVMTRPDHPSGTDRVAEAAAAHGGDVVVNIQGDEAMIDPDLIDGLGSLLAEDPGWDMATAATPIGQAEDVAASSVVKVVWGADHQALYFSRSAIPHLRDGGDAPGLYWRHLGIYAYQREFLERLVATPPCPLEQAEKLEQLRALHLGCRMQVLETRDTGFGVDVPEDVPRLEAALKAAGLVD